MPVVTRSQSIKATPKVEKPAEEKPVPAKAFADPVVQNLIDGADADYQNKKNIFVNAVKKGLLNCQVAVGKTEKLIVAHTIYLYISQNLPELFEKSPATWIQFMVSVYSKIVEFESLRDSGNLVCSPRLINGAFGTFERVKRFCVPHLMDTRFDCVFTSRAGPNGIMGLDQLTKVREHIKKTWKTHSMALRKGKFVNYRGMC